MKARSILGLTFFVTLLGCSALVIDPSMDAVEAGDSTLAISACEATPGGGYDICRVKSGDRIESSWKLFIPIGKRITGGEVDVYYRDIHKSYPINSPILEIPWKEFFGAETWSKAQDGQALALLFIRWKDDNGIEQITKFRGIAQLVVTAPGYDRLPVDSGFGGFKTSCKITYSTAGRGNVTCK